MKMQRFLTCYAREHEGAWEAWCLDLDIAVQGQTFDEVRATLDHAIGSYLSDAAAEAPAARDALLGRRAPFFARLRWLLPFVTHTLFARNRDGDTSVGFQVACRV